VLPFSVLTQPLCCEMT